MTATKECPYCHGTGAVWVRTGMNVASDWQDYVCDDCDGTGRVPVMDGVADEWADEEKK